MELHPIHGFVMGMCMMWDSMVHLFTRNASSFGIVMQDRKHIAFTTALGDFHIIPLETHIEDEVLVGVHYCILHPSDARIQSDIKTLQLSDGYEVHLANFKKALMLMMATYPFLIGSLGSVGARPATQLESSSHESPMYSL